MIELETVTVRYGDRIVLDSLSMAISGTGCVAIQGASGIGKTTLLRVLAGLVLPQSGKVSGLGNRRVGVVFQEDRLLPWCTALENAAIAGDPQDAETYLSRLGLAGAENMFPSELSGGMRRRVSIARAMVFSDDVLLLDEPFNGLDASCRIQVANALLAHAKLLIVVTHDAHDAELLNAQQHILLS